MVEYYCEELTEMTPEDLQVYLNGKARHGYKLQNIFRIERNTYEVVLCKETITDALNKLHAAEKSRRAEQDRIKQEWSALPWWKKILRRF